MRKSLIIAGIVTLFLLFSVPLSINNTVFAQPQGCDPSQEILPDSPGGHHGPSFLEGLTDEQREAIREKIKEMQSQGASREEIHAAVAEMLKGYGIEAPEDSAGPQGPGCFGPPPGGFWKDLTKEQREAVKEKIKEMRSQNASREEIHSAVTEMLKGYGIEVPADSAGPHGLSGFGPGPRGFWKDLTKEQREAVQDKIKEMRSQNASREEIHSAVTEILKGYGIEVPEDSVGPQGRGGFGPGPRGFWKDLTKEQREAVQEKIKEMKSQGAKREEIRTAVAEMLKGYGIEVPKDWRGPIGFGQRHDGWGANLTDEQREAIREKIKEMKSQGATREEIHTAVAEMLKGYGIKMPADSTSISSGTAPAEPNIRAQSYPNPFNPETQINYTLSVAGNVRIQIYNVAGQIVRTFNVGYQQAGNYSVGWDGHNEKGDPSASGVYLYRIEAGPYTLTNRMVLLK
jgi:DNA-binding transcriptional regulator YhcF (GntR family)